MRSSRPPTGRGNNQSWLFLGPVATVSLTYVSSVDIGHQERTKRKASFGGPSISVVANVPMFFGPQTRRLCLCTRMAWGTGGKRWNASLLIYVSLLRCATLCRLFLSHRLLHCDITLVFKSDRKFSLKAKPPGHVAWQTTDCARLWTSHITIWRVHVRFWIH